jgi:putative transposase
MKAFKYKLKTNKIFVAECERTLGICRELYNAAVQERRDAWQINAISINYGLQSAQLPLIKQFRPDVKGVYAQILQDTLRRVEKAFKAFFRRVKNGEKPGYPRFKGKSRYNSFTYPQDGFKLEGNKLILSGIGSVRVRLSRPIEGRIRTCTITREVDGWYVVFTADNQSVEYSFATGESVGIDVGIEAFATLSTGERIENERFMIDAERNLKTAQRRLARRKKFGKNWRKASRLLAKRHKKVQRQRRDFHFKRANDLVARFDTIKFEDLAIKNMVKNEKLAKHIHDAGWRQFISITAFKAEEAGACVLVVNPNGTSQICSQCKRRVPKDLSDRWHECSHCGFSVHRDHNSALEIKNRSGRPFVDGGAVRPSRETRISAYSHALVA